MVEMVKRDTKYHAELVSASRKEANIMAKAKMHPMEITMDMEW